MKIRAIQFAPVLGNMDKNFEFHVEKIEAAAVDGVDLIIFPELSITGYDLKDLVYENSFNKDHKMHREFLRLSKSTDILIGAPWEEEAGIIYNAAILYSAGEVVHIHKKVQLPNFGMFEEAMNFRKGDSFMAFPYRGFTAGIIICREILFPSIAWLYFMQKTDLLLGISNSPFRGLGDKGFSSLSLWERAGEVNAVNYHQNYLFVNRTGFENGMGFGGGSFYAAPGKGIVDKCLYFDADEMDVEFEPDAARNARFSANYLRDENPEIIMNELKRITDVHNR